MNQYEKTIEREEIFSGRIVNLRVDKVLLPNGKTSFREVVEHRQGVGILPIDGDRIIFVKQYRKAIERVIVEIPAGLVEEGENPKDAAVRELQEEIGLKPTRLKWIGEIWPTPGCCNEKTVLYVAEHFIDHAEKPDDDEFIEKVVLPIKTVKALYKRGLFTDAKTVCALGHFFSN